MKHTFLFDENILYFAAKVVDPHDRPDVTCAELLKLIADNCHTVTTTPKLNHHYRRHLIGLQQARLKDTEPLRFLLGLMKNADKFHVEEQDPPLLPTGVQVPRKDVHIVRAALLSGALIVTGDTKLRDSVNAEPSLGLRALSPMEALELAGDQ